MAELFIHKYNETETKKTIPGVGNMTQWLSTLPNYQTLRKNNFKRPK